MLLHLCQTFFQSRHGTAKPCAEKVGLLSFIHDVEKIPPHVVGLHGGTELPAHIGTTTH